MSAKILFKFGGQEIRSANLIPSPLPPPPQQTSTSLPVDPDATDEDVPPVGQAREQSDEEATDSDVPQQVRVDDELTESERTESDQASDVDQSDAEVQVTNQRQSRKREPRSKGRPRAGAAGKRRRIARADSESDMEVIATGGLRDAIDGDDELVYSDDSLDEDDDIDASEALQDPVQAMSKLQSQLVAYSLQPSTLSAEQICAAAPLSTEESSLPLIGISVARASKLHRMFYHVTMFSQNKLQLRLLRPRRRYRALLPAGSDFQADVNTTLLPQLRPTPSLLNEQDVDMTAGQSRRSRMSAHEFEAYASGIQTQSSSRKKFENSEDEQRALEQEREKRVAAAKRRKDAADRRDEELRRETLTKLLHLSVVKTPKIDAIKAKRLAIDPNSCISRIVRIEVPSSAQAAAVSPAPPAICMRLVQELDDAQTDSGARIVNLLRVPVQSDIALSAKTTDEWKASHLASALPSSVAPVSRTCAAPGCSLPRKFADSVTKQSACSLACVKALHQLASATAVVLRPMPQPNPVWHVSPVHRKKFVTPW